MRHATMGPELELSHPPTHLVIIYIHHRGRMGLVGQQQ